jgi:hypothetical protein
LKTNGSKTPKIEDFVQNYPKSDRLLGKLKAKCMDGISWNPEREGGKT